MYCATEELRRLTSSELSNLVLEEIIDQADRQIRGRIVIGGASPPDDNEILKAASLSLSMIGVAMHPDSDQLATSIKLGDITIKREDLGTSVMDMTKLAWANVDGYIRSSSSDPSRFYFRKVNR